MTSRSTETKNARKLERLYRTKEHGTKHTTVLNLIRDHGLDGAMAQLEAWGMVAETTCGVCHYIHCVCPR
jgi:hypothetical protein